jgi:hypothetical protein
MSTISSFAHLSDKALLAEAKALAAVERVATAQLIAALAELDARRLYLPQGCRSMFTYCTEILHLSEYAAYARIETARAARRFPCILTLLESGAITLTTVGLLAAHLTDENHERLLTSARHKSKRQVEALVVALKPQPPAPSVVRKLPARPGIERQSPPIFEANRPPVLAGRIEGTRAAQTAAVQTGAAAQTAPAAQTPAAPPGKPAIVTQLAPERYKLQLTMSRETHDKLRRVQDLMRHTNPTGDPAVIFDRAITMLLNSLEKAKLGATDRPRTSAAALSAKSGKSGKSGKSRHIPAAVKREVWRRDAGRCAFIGDAGRCTETGCLEYHHVVAFADGGAASVSNIQLRCRAHNAHEAERWFGPLIAREERSVYEQSNWVRFGSG